MLTYNVCIYIYIFMCVGVGIGVGVDVDIDIDIDMQARMYVPESMYPHVHISVYYTYLHRYIVIFMHPCTILRPVLPAPAVLECKNRNMSFWLLMHAPTVQCCARLGGSISSTRLV